MLPNELREALETASRDHDDTYEHIAECESLPDCINGIVATAIINSGNENTNDQTIMNCVYWVLDELTQSLILKGYMEVDRLNEDGEFIYATTEKAAQLFRNIYGG